MIHPKRAKIHRTEDKAHKHVIDSLTSKDTAGYVFVRIIKDEDDLGGVEIQTRLPNHVALALLEIAKIQIASSEPYEVVAQMPDGSTRPLN